MSFRNEVKSRYLTVIIAMSLFLIVSRANPQQEQEQESTNSIGMKLRLIPAGSFLMGSNNGNEDEKPVHKVEISRPFFIGVYEVTQAQYEAVMGKNPAVFKGSNRPVESVSWLQAFEFCRRLSEKEGEEYRLPTEAEWEYACRAGTTTEYYWGNSSSESEVKKYGWYKLNAEEKSWSEPHATSEGVQNVGRKLPNTWGLYDMSGNVWELCGDNYHQNYYSRSPLKDPRARPGNDMLSSITHVLRGGAWCEDEIWLRSSSRFKLNSSDLSNSVGFRVVREFGLRDAMRKTWREANAVKAKPLSEEERKFEKGLPPASSQLTDIQFDEITKELAKKIVAIGRQRPYTADVDAVRVDIERSFEEWLNPPLNGLPTGIGPLELGKIFVGGKVWKPNRYVLVGDATAKVAYTRRLPGCTFNVYVDDARKICAFSVVLSDTNREIIEMVFISFQRHFDKWWEGSSPAFEGGVKCLFHQPGVGSEKPRSLQFQFWNTEFEIDIFYGRYW